MTWPTLVLPPDSGTLDPLATVLERTYTAGYTMRDPLGNENSTSIQILYPEYVAPGNPPAIDDVREWAEKAGGLSDGMPKSWRLTIEEFFKDEDMFYNDEPGTNAQVMVFVYEHPDTFDVQYARVLAVRRTHYPNNQINFGATNDFREETEDLLTDYVLTNIYVLHGKKKVAMLPGEPLDLREP